jgi:hypothetical protein
MKQFILFATIILLFSFCKKKNETPDFSAMIAGKWVCNSYKKDDADTIENRRPYSISLRYDYGWEFSQKKQLRFKTGIGWDADFENNNYVLTDNKTLTLNLVDANNAVSKSEYDIIVLSADKLTVHSALWKATFFLLKE